MNCQSECKNCLSLNRCASCNFISRFYGKESCNLCNENCYSCINDSKCITCKSGKAKILNSNLCSLSTGKYKPCSNFCKKCINSEICKECFNGYLLFNGKCYKKCEDGLI